MEKRVQLQADLENLLGSRNVYYQPPETVKLCYPCIIYSRDDEDVLHANDKPYKRQVRYSVVVIDKNPDSLIPGKIADLPLCSFERHYTKDNLNHDVYNLYY